MIQSIQEQRKDTKEKKQNGGKIGGENYLRFKVPTTWQIWEDNGM